MRAADEEKSALPACRAGGGRSRARATRRANSAPRTPRQGGADTDKCRPRTLLGYRGERRRAGQVHAPMCACRPQSANRAHSTVSTPIRGGGCARVLAARHDALATRLGGAMRTRPRAVRSAHSARTSTWVGRGGGLLAPSAERETLPSHRGTVVTVERRGGHVHIPPAKHDAVLQSVKRYHHNVETQQWHSSG